VPGLEGVVATQTAISKVADGELVYRGYHIDELAGKADYEEVAYLLLHGSLPDARALARFRSELEEQRDISPMLRRLVDDMSENGTPMDVLRTVISATSLEDPDEGDSSADAGLRKAIRLTAKLPTVLAAYIRRRKGLEPIAPQAGLGHAANFAHMALGDDAHPRAADVLNACFILQAEHGLNASTFTARVVASTEADMHAAVSGALGALKGAKHGGATDGTMRMLEEIKTPERAADWVAKAIEGKLLISGFGHRVYKTNDPREKHLRGFTRMLAKDWRGPKYFEIQEAVAEAVATQRATAKESVRSKLGVVNVDYYAATTYTYLGIAADLGTSIFAVGRIAGWCAHIMEQHASNRIIRPESEYTGPLGKTWVPVEDR
jgi:citrate synthase